MNNTNSQPVTIKDQTEVIKDRCAEAVLKALTDYHYPGMGTDELKTIVRNVIANKVETTLAR